MKRLPLFVLLSLSLSAALAQPVPASNAPAPIVRGLASGQTVVVAEGRLEARSTGSYSVRLYEAAPETDRTTFYQDGVVVSREGSVEKVILANIAGTGHEDIVVVVRSVGSGSYLSARAFAYDQNNLSLIAQVDDLPPNADPVAALRQSLKTPSSEHSSDAPSP
jgi:hypothetical protein